MADMTEPFLVALHAALIGDSALTALVPAPRIGDDTGQGTTYPYINTGDYDSDDAGTKTTEAQLVRLSLHVWSQYQGNSEVLGIFAALHDLLNSASLTVVGGTNPIIMYKSQTVLRDPDGRTRHGVTNYEAMVCSD